MRQELLSRSAVGGARGREDGPRILIYGHDSWGLGHLRRNLTLAKALTSKMPGASVLLVTGSPCATTFPTPERVEIVKLPSVTKNDAGCYAPRNLPCSLSSVLHLRRRILFEAYRVFQPRLVLVDHKVVGLHGEACELLEDARRRGIKTILGVRDIIDSPEAVAREWGSDRCRWALAEAYDRVCVYGDPTIFDPRLEYPIPEELGERLEFVGYVVREFHAKSRRPVPATRQQVLVSMGGGEDGSERVAAFLNALELRTEAFPSAPRFTSIVLTGPMLEERAHRALKRRARILGDVEVHRFHADLPRVLAESDAVVSMAGYNTCAEILESKKPSVLLPRTFPRKEQSIRASRFEQCGLAENARGYGAEELREAIERALAGTGEPPIRPDLSGAEGLVDVAQELLHPGRILRGVPRKRSLVI